MFRTARQVGEQESENSEDFRKTPDRRYDLDLYLNGKVAITPECTGQLQPQARGRERVRTTYICQDDAP